MWHVLIHGLGGVWIGSCSGLTLFLHVLWGWIRIRIRERVGLYVGSRTPYRGTWFLLLSKYADRHLLCTCDEVSLSDS